MELKPPQSLMVFFSFLNIYISTLAGSEDPYRCCKNGILPGIGRIWDCRRCRLQQVPSNPPADVKAVRLEANEIKEIPKGSFKNYSNVVWLHLGNNSLTLEKGTAYFDDIPQLTHLYLPRNPIILSSLSENNPDVFQEQSKLTLLNIYRVEFNDFDDRHFVEYPGKFLAPLRHLNLAILPPVSFERFGSYFLNLTNLHELSLLSSMPEAKVLWTEMKNETFKHLPHLKSLTLMDSSLRTIDPDAFKPLQNLQKIEVFCSDLQAIEIVQALENLPQPSLKTLVFEYDRSLVDIQRNKTFRSLKNLNAVTMGIPFMVPHPNPFMLDFLPIFWESVTQLEIIQPFSDVFVRTVYKNPDQPYSPELEIAISNTIKYIPYRSACIMTSITTKVNVLALNNHTEHSTTTARQYASRPVSKYALRAMELSGQSTDDTKSSSKEHTLEQNTMQEVTTDAKLTNSISLPSNNLKTSRTTHVDILSNHSISNDLKRKLAKHYLRNTSKILHPGCYSGQFSASICFRLLSLTLTFYINYAQSQVFDLVIKQGESLGIHTELSNLEVNHFLYDTLPGDGILKNLVEFKFPGASVTQLSSRNMPKLQVYDISYNSIDDLCNTRALSRLHSLQVLYASNNQLVCIDKSSFAYASNLNFIDLSNNNFKSFSLDISHLSKLQFINLTKNQIEYLSGSFMEQIANHSNLQIDLTNNSLACTCGSQNISFIIWMLHHQDTFLDFDKYECLDMKGNVRLIKDTDIAAYKAECRSKLVLYIAIPLCCSLVLVIVMTLSYRHRWRIMWYSYLITSSCNRDQRRRRQLRHPEGMPLIKDVFLSYAQEDMDVRIPVLERLLALGFSVMHPELFEWGVSVFQQTVDSIQRSAKIVFLVTRNFAQCKFCNFQLHMAYVKGYENIILLQMDSLSELTSVGMQPFLQNLLQADGTYDYVDDDFFWNRLQDALIA